MAGILCREFEADYYGDEQSGPRFVAVAVTDQILENSARLVAVHGLRAYDSVQLASALAVNRADADGVTFLAFDKNLNTAASTEGLVTVELPQQGTDIAH